MGYAKPLSSLQKKKTIPFSIYSFLSTIVLMQQLFNKTKIPIPHITSAFFNPFLAFYHPKHQKIFYQHLQKHTKKKNPTISLSQCPQYIKAFKNQQNKTIEQPF